MKQKKVDLKLEWAPGDNGELQKAICLQEPTADWSEPAWRVQLTETEFLELAELIYVEYCRVRRRMGMHNQPNIGQSGNAYFISLKMYSELIDMAMGDQQVQALRRLLSVSGTRDDLLVTKRLCALSGQHGYMAMISIVLTEDRK